MPWENVCFSSHKIGASFSSWFKISLDLTKQLDLSVWEHYVPTRRLSCCNKEEIQNKWHWTCRFERSTVMEVFFTCPPKAAHLSTTLHTALFWAPERQFKILMWCVYLSFTQKTVEVGRSVVEVELLTKSPGADSETSGPKIVQQWSSP